jgi:hypothetical protein
MARTRPSPRCCWTSSVSFSFLPADAELDGERLVDGRDGFLRELDVDHGADDLDDFAGVVHEKKMLGGVEVGGIRPRELRGGDFEDFLGDGGLAGLVVFEGEVADELGGVVLGGLHRDHAGAVLGGLGIEHLSW